MSLTRSLIPQQHRPILDQLLVRLGLRQGQVLIIALIVIGSRDDFHLKDYATVLAAFVAVGGALLAYRGAMAKVYEDRDRERREIDRKKMGICLRLRFAVHDMGERASDVRRILNSYQTLAGKISPEAVRIDVPQEIEDAWNSLELLPLDASLQLNAIRSELSKMARCMGALDTSQSIAPWHGYGVPRAHPLHPCAQSCDLVANCSEVLLKALDQEINRIKDRDQ